MRPILGMKNMRYKKVSGRSIMKNLTRAAALCCLLEDVLRGRTGAGFQQEGQREKRHQVEPADEEAHVEGDGDMGQRSHGSYSRQLIQLAVNLGEP